MEKNMEKICKGYVKYMKRYIKDMERIRKEDVNNM